jgi:osmotically-inducible protein OsmY
MRHEYSQSRYGSSGRTRGYDDDRDNESSFDRDDYGQANSAQANPAMEAENNRYGREFNEDRNSGRRTGQGNRVQGGNQGWYGGQEVQGPYGRREQAGRSSFGSSKYGGSDYADNDYRRNESRYGSPYSELSSRQRLGEDLSDHSRYDSSDSDIIGGQWNQTRGGGEWYGEDRAGTLRQTYGRSQPRAYEQYGYRNGMQEQGSEFATQSFRGRGPKGYERSDERLKEIICEALTDAPHIDASEISVDVKKGEVTLSGTVEDRRAKHAAEDLIEQCAGVNEIQNQLRIRGQSGSQPSGSQSAQQQSSQEGARPGISRGVTQGASSQNTASQSGKSDQDSNASSGKNSSDRSLGKNGER